MRAANGQVVLGRNQYTLLTSALVGLLAVLVEDLDADVPVAKDPWAGAGLRRGEGTGPTWQAINQARGVLAASREWVDVSRAEWGQLA